MAQPTRGIGHIEGHDSSNAPRVLLVGTKEFFVSLRKLLIQLCSQFSILRVPIDLHVKFSDVDLET